MVGQQLCFALETSTIHWFGQLLSPMQLSLLRSGGGLLLVVCLLPSVGLKVLRTQQFKLQLVRALRASCYLVVLTVSLTHLPLADASALSYTVALYIPLFGYLILGERVDLRRGAAGVVGFLGALLLINPAMSLPSTLVYIAVLLGTSLNAIAYVLNRRLQERDNPVTVLLYVNLICFVAFLPAAAQSWPSDPTSLIMMTPIVVIGSLGMLLGIYAVRYADVATRHRTSTPG